jgi:hypothetical protein
MAVGRDYASSVMIAVVAMMVRMVGHGGSGMQ